MDKYTCNVFVHHDSDDMVTINDSELFVGGRKADAFYFRNFISPASCIQDEWKYFIEFEYAKLTISALGCSFSKVQLLFDDKDRALEVTEEINKRFKAMYPKLF